jgi:hypothetical protein
MQIGGWNISVVHFSGNSSSACHLGFPIGYVMPLKLGVIVCDG